MLGELKCFNGSIHLFGQPVSKFRTWHKIGYVPPNWVSKTNGFSCYCKRSCAGKFILFSWSISLSGQKKETTKVEKTLSLLHMEDFSSRLIGELSGGQRQKGFISPCIGIESQSLNFR